MLQEALTIEEVAKVLKVSRETVYRLAAAGQLPGRKVGRIWRFSATAIERYLDACSAEPHSGPVRHPQ